MSTMSPNRNRNRKHLSVDRIITALAGRELCDSCDLPVAEQFDGRPLYRFCFHKEARRDAPRFPARGPPSSEQ